MDHVLRVRSTARKIRAEVGGDIFEIELAALLHDIGDAKFNSSQERSGEFSQAILTGLNVPNEVVPHVVDIVGSISFRERRDSRELTLEGRIVQDADRLDALGSHRHHSHDRIRGCSLGQFLSFGFG